MEELAKNLKNVAKIRREIKGLELAIHGNRKTMASDVVSGSSDKFPYGRRSFRIEGFDQRRDSALQIRLRQKKKKLEREVLEVERVLDVIDDPQLRNAIRHKFEMGKTWEEVGRECGVSGEAIKKKVQRFLAKL